MSQLDLPLITEATSDYYRQIYADPDLGPIFRGINMVVLRQHVSYFLHQLAMFDTPLTTRQLDYLRRVHQPVIAAHAVTQKHYDLMMGYLVEAMVANGAQDDHLVAVQAKLQPLRDIFPPVGSVFVDGQVLLDQGDGARSSNNKAVSNSNNSSNSGSGTRQAPCCERDQATNGKGHVEDCQQQQDDVPVAAKKKKSWMKRLIRSFSSSKR